MRGVGKKEARGYAKKGKNKMASPKKKKSHPLFQNFIRRQSWGGKKKEKKDMNKPKPPNFNSACLEIKTEGAWARRGGRGKGPGFVRKGKEGERTIYFGKEKKKPNTRLIESENHEKSVTRARRKKSPLRADRAHAVAERKTRRLWSGKTRKRVSGDHSGQKKKKRGK